MSHSFTSINAVGNLNPGAAYSEEHCCCVVLLCQSLTASRSPLLLFLYCELTRHIYSRLLNWCSAKLARQQGVRWTLSRGLRHSWRHIWSHVQKKKKNTQGGTCVKRGRPRTWPVAAWLEGCFQMVFLDISLTITHSHVLICISPPLPEAKKRKSPCSSRLCQNEWTARTPVYAC